MGGMGWWPYLENNPPTSNGIFLCPEIFSFHSTAQYHWVSETQEKEHHNFINIGLYWVRVCPLCYPRKFALCYPKKGMLIKRKIRLGTPLISLGCTSFKFFCWICVGSPNRSTLSELWANRWQKCNCRGIPSSKHSEISYNVNWYT